MKRFTISVNQGELDTLSSLVENAQNYGDTNADLTSLKQLFADNEFLESDDGEPEPGDEGGDADGEGNGDNGDDAGDGEDNGAED